MPYMNNGVAYPEVIATDTVQWMIDIVTDVVVKLFMELGQHTSSLINQIVCQCCDIILLRQDIAFEFAPNTAMTNQIVVVRKSNFVYTANEDKFVDISVI